MKVKEVSLSSLVFPDKNVRRHPEAQIREYVKSIQQFGQTKPIVIDENDVILVGNGLAMALGQAGMTKAWVLKKTDLTELQKKKLMLADNRIYSMGTDFLDTQMEFLKEIGLDNDFEVPGFDEEVMKSLIMTRKEVDDEIGKYASGITTEAQRIVDTPSPPNAAAAPEGNEVKEVGSVAPKSMGCPHCGEVIWL